MQLKRNCKECDGTFEISQFQVERGRGIFCGKYCASLFKLKTYNFFRDWKRNWRGQGHPHTEKTKKFLSNLNLGSKNPNYKDGLSSYRTKNSSWKNFARTIRKRDKYTCLRCKKMGSIIHHMLPVRLGGSDELSNLITLCRTCHGYIESKVIA